MQSAQRGILGLCLMPIYELSTAYSQLRWIKWPDLTISEIKDEKSIGISILLQLGDKISNFWLANYGEAEYFSDV